jgi:hypothetical protein
VECKGEKGNSGRHLVETSEGRMFSENHGINGSILLKCVLKKDGMTWTGFIWRRIRTGGGLL